MRHFFSFVLLIVVLIFLTWALYDFFCTILRMVTEKDEDNGKEKGEPRE